MHQPLSYPCNQNSLGEMYLIKSVNGMMLCSGKGTMATVTTALTAKL